MLRKRDKIKEQIRAKLRIFNSWILQDIINER